MDTSPNPDPLDIDLANNRDNPAPQHAPPTFPNPSMSAPLDLTLSQPHISSALPKVTNSAALPTHINVTFSCPPNANNPAYLFTSDDLLQREEPSSNSRDPDNLFVSPARFLAYNQSGRIHSQQQQFRHNLQHSTANSSQRAHHPYPDQMIAVRNFNAQQHAAQQHALQQRRLVPARPTMILPNQMPGSLQQPRPVQARKPRPSKAKPKVIHKVSTAEAVRMAAQMDRPPTRRSSKGGWTSNEDDMLRVVVMEHNEKNWKNIAKALNSAYGGGRNDVQCLHRWQKVLQPGLKKGPWTQHEDDTITRLVSELGANKWSLIAKQLPGRIGKQCRERWFNHLNPEINKDPWTEEEEEVLRQAHAKFGNKWALIAKYLTGRTDNAIKNHYNATQRRAATRKQGRKGKGKICPANAQLPGASENIGSAPTDPNAKQTDGHHHAKLGKLAPRPMLAPVGNQGAGVSTGSGVHYENKENHMESNVAEEKVSKHTSVLHMPSQVAITARVFSDITNNGKVTMNVDDRTAVKKRPLTPGKKPKADVMKRPKPTTYVSGRDQANLFPVDDRALQAAREACSVQEISMKKNAAALSQPISIQVTSSNGSGKRNAVSNDQAEKVVAEREEGILPASNSGSARDVIEFKLQTPSQGGKRKSVEGQLKGDDGYSSVEFKPQLLSDESENNNGMGEIKLATLDEDDVNAILHSGEYGANVGMHLDGVKMSPSNIKSNRRMPFSTPPRDSFFSGIRDPTSASGESPRGMLLRPMNLDSSGLGMTPTPFGKSPASLFLNVSPHVGSSALLPGVLSASRPGGLFTPGGLFASTPHNHHRSRLDSTALASPSNLNNAFASSSITPTKGSRENRDLLPPLFSPPTSGKRGKALGSALADRGDGLGRMSNGVLGSELRIRGTGLTPFLNGSRNGDDNGGAEFTPMRSPTRKLLWSTPGKDQGNSSVGREGSASGRGLRNLDPLNSIDQFLAPTPDSSRK